MGRGHSLGGAFSRRGIVLGERSVPGRGFYLGAWPVSGLVFSWGRGLFTTTFPGVVFSLGGAFRGVAVPGGGAYWMNESC